MKPWSQYAPSERAAVTRIFEAMLMRDALIGGGDEAQAVSAAERPIGQEDLYRYAVGDSGEEDRRRVSFALREHPRLRRDLDHLLERSAVLQIPTAAAAADGALDRREVTGVRIEWQASEVEPDQTYLLITFTRQPIEPPRFLIVRRGDLEVICEPLPPPTDGLIQLVMSGAAPVIEALKDWRTKIFLG